MRRGHAGKVDSNQAAIVEALRKSGCSVLSLASLGSGVPDLLVSNGRSYVLIEVKRPGEKVNRQQMLWHANWKGAVWIVTSVEEALKVLAI